MGNADIRRLLVLGAVARTRHSSRNPSSHDIWYASLRECKPGRLAAVAMANKMARIVWAVMKNGTTYQPGFLPVAA
jgi:transposase